ncbi:acyltransferase family protein [Serratia sp. D1N4]
MAGERIVFANILRGVGAITVLISHYAGIFWVMHPAISSLMGVPALSHFPELDFPLSLLSEFCIFLGQFGVGVFFIVSGLVIPFSLRSDSKTGFLYRRAIRIYPVYIVGFSITMLSLYGLSFYASVPFKFSLGDIVAHFGVITRGPLNVTRIDGISWTLEVEIYFYLVMCVFGMRIINFDAKKYIATSLVIAGISAVVFKTQGYLIGVQTASSLLLLLGTSYYSLINQKISIKESLIIQTTVVTLILLLWFGVANYAEYIIQWAVGYILSITVFYICFVLRDKIKENPILSHFSNISYPLYVVHALFGYTIMYILVDSGLGPYSAIATATFCAYIAALLIHLFVEKPSMAWIKRSKMNTSATNSTLMTPPTTRE